MILALASLLLTGCYLDAEGRPSVDPEIDEQDFPSVWAANWCSRESSCDPAEFDDNWDDADSCRADVGDDADFAADWGDMFCGSYDADAAMECVRAMNEMSCADFNDDEWRNECEAVFGC